jgi:hypothetical protein
MGGIDFRTTNKDAAGNLIIAPTFENTDGLHPQWVGHKYTATAGATNVFDQQITTEKQLRSGWYELFTDNAGDDDYIEEAVVDKDDVLGLFSTYGLTVGVHTLELKKYIKTKHINPLNAGTRQNFAVDSTFIIYAGLYLRTIYESTGLENVIFEVVPQLYE